MSRSNNVYTGRRCLEQPNTRKAITREKLHNDILRVVDNNLSFVYVTVGVITTRRSLLVVDGKRVFRNNVYLRYVRSNQLHSRTDH